MRSFFVQIFLSFWISTICIFVAANIAFPSGDVFRPDNLVNSLARFVTLVTKLEVKKTPAEACQDSRQISLLLLDERQHDICGNFVPSDLAQLASRVRLSDRTEVKAISRSWALAEPVKEAGSGSLVAVLNMPFKRGDWFPHLPPYAIPVSALVTFVFAYLLTRPVRALRTAFRRFAGGDMLVRLPVSRNALRDWGGADVRTLMIDFNEMADRIQALVEAQKTLLRDVSHELRSPLARLNVALELARDEVGSSPALDRAELESSRLNSLIGELLSLSNMETINDVPNPKSVCLAELIEKLMPDLQFEAQARGCGVNYKSAADCTVEANEELLRRALENVIRNAIRYSPSGEEVSIEIGKHDSGTGTKVLVQICDSGPGVPEDNLQAIFRPFYRVDVARQTSTGGFGVGLAIAQRALQVHGGSIRAFNKQSGGLCVELSLPCARASIG